MKNIFWIIPIVLLASCTKVHEVKDPITGELIEKYEYKLDKDGQKIKHGKYIEWDFENVKVLEANYKDGLLHGKKQKWNKNGDLYFQGNYFQGENDGKLEYLNSKGIKTFEAEYDRGMPIGTWYGRNSDGETVYELNFENGACKQFVGEWAGGPNNSEFFTIMDDGNFEFYVSSRKGKELKSKGKVKFHNNLVSFVNEAETQKDKTAGYFITSVNEDKIRLEYTSELLSMANAYKTKYQLNRIK